MGVASAMVDQRRLLCGPQPTDAGAEIHRLASGLSALVRDVAATVPSLLAASLTVTRHGERATVTAYPRPLAPSPTRVMASLAIPLPSEGSLLVLRGAAAGAFVLLADDLAASLGVGAAALALDEHLDLPVAPAEQAPTPGLDDLRVTDRAIGVLLDRGLSPQEGLAELGRLADQAGLRLGAVSRALLEGARPTED